jgi:hypothetical protein
MPNRPVDAQDFPGTVTVSKTGWRMNEIRGVKRHLGLLFRGAIESASQILGEPGRKGSNNNKW